MRDLISSAHRLNVIGPLEGARMQAEFSGVLEGMFQKREELNNPRTLSLDHNTGTYVDAEEAELKTNFGICFEDRFVFRPKQTAPILELLQASHDNLYSRLFNS